MADIGNIKARISEIAQRGKNVAFSEIEWVVNQLGQHNYEVASRQARHGKLFRVGSQRFMINYHNPGSKQVKGYSVQDFIHAMTELGLYEE
jgi:hypothetical protein